MKPGEMWWAGSLSGAAFDCPAAEGAPTPPVAPPSMQPGILEQGRVSGHVCGAARRRSGVVPRTSLARSHNRTNAIKCITTPAPAR